MKFANYTKFYRDRQAHGIEYAAKHTAKLGFDSVEYFTCAPSTLLQSAKEERAVLDHYGLDVVCYSVSVQLFCNDQKQAEEQMLREVEAAAILGSPCFHHTLYPKYLIDATPKNYDEVFERITNVAERIARACNQNGMICLYEPQGAYFNGVTGLDQIVTEMARRGCNVGVCGDFGNSLFVDVDPCEIFEHFAIRIRHVHVKDYLVADTEDATKKADFSASGKLIYDAELGSGSVDFARGFAALKQANYQGNISFETEGSDEELQRALRFIKNTIQNNNL